MSLPALAYEGKQPLGQEMSCTQGWHRGQAGVQAAVMPCAKRIWVSAQSVPLELSLRARTMERLPLEDSGAAGTRPSCCFASAPAGADIPSVSSRCWQQAFAAASAQSCHLVDAGKLWRITG